VASAAALLVSKRITLGRRLRLRRHARAGRAHPPSRRSPTPRHASAGRPKLCRRICCRGFETGDRSRRLGSHCTEAGWANTEGVAADLVDWRRRPHRVPCLRRVAGRRARRRRSRQSLQQQQSLSRTGTIDLRAVTRLSASRHPGMNETIYEILRSCRVTAVIHLAGKGRGRFQRSAHDVLREQRLRNDAACVGHARRQRSRRSSSVLPLPFTGYPRTCRSTRSIRRDRQIRTAAQSFSSKKCCGISIGPTTNGGSAFCATSIRLARTKAGLSEKIRWAFRTTCCRLWHKWQLEVATS
jgi:hypothetical protein